MNLTRLFALAQFLARDQSNATPYDRRKIDDDQPRASDPNKTLAQNLRSSPNWKSAQMATICQKSMVVGEIKYSAVRTTITSEYFQLLRGDATTVPGVAANFRAHRPNYAAKVNYGCLSRNAKHCERPAG